MSFSDIYAIVSFCWVVIQFGEWLSRKIKKK